MANKLKQKEDSKDEKDGKQDKQKNASLGKRFVAFVIDILIISFVASIICVPFTNVENENKLEEEYLNSTQSFFDNPLTLCQSVYSPVFDHGIVDHPVNLYQIF